LCFEAVGHIARVYVNDRFVGEHFGGYTSFSFDIAPYVSFGSDNFIRVEVDSRETNNLPPFGNVIDYMTYGGIYREVYLLVKPSLYIEDVFVKTKDVMEDEKSLSLQITLSDAVNDVIVMCELQKVGEDTWRYLGHKSVTDVSVLVETKVTDVELWEIENPNLYNVRVSLWGQGEKETISTNLSTKSIRFSKQELRKQGYILQDIYETRIGFRSCEFRKDGFYLNDKKTKLLGLNRHQSYPYVGYAMPKRPQQLDADILKFELGLQAVRTSHYPQSQHFIDRCDEIGLLVFTEIPGWQYIGDEEWKEIACESVKEMVLQYRNHPSIVLWGVRINESMDDAAFYEKTNAMAHQLDDTRQTGGVRCIAKSDLLEDVYTFNDFSHIGINEGLQKKSAVTSKEEKSYLVSEYNGHMFPTKAFDDEAHRLSHAKRHANVVETFYQQEEIAGAFGWCMFDYNTHKDFGSGDRICYHGVMTMFRNPKLAASVYASQGRTNPVLILSSSMDIGEHPGGYIGPVYAFTNADFVALYKNNQFVKNFYPDVKAKMPHNPIVIDDFIGVLIEKEGYSKKNQERIKEVLTGVAKYGQNNLPIRTKLKMVLVMVQEKLKFEDGMRLFYEYVGNWGGESTSYRFDGMKDNQVVSSIIKEAVKEIQLAVSIDTTTLVEADSYDVATVRIKAVDQNKQQLMVYHGVITLEVTGDIALIGPKSVSMTGGSTGTYIKSLGRSGMGKLTITAEQMEPVDIHVQVCQADEG
ncbi:MAG: glycoside hydrolase family 2 TIM barrel-domain containing protein, partial [Eubacteriales bacterium]